MGRSLILFLSLFTSVSFSISQSHKEKQLKCDCAAKSVRDSLVVRFLDAAEELPHMYNNPIWEYYCDSVIAACPDIALAYRQKAIPFIKNGEYEKAFALNDKAVLLDPKEWTAYRGFLKCIFTKDYEGAIPDFQKAQELIPNGFEMDHTYLFYEGLCNLELGNYKKAEENFKKDLLIQKINDKEGNGHFNSLLYMGVLYYEMKENAKAKEYLQMCLSSYKELPDANYYLGLVYKRENNIQLSKKYFQIAKQSRLEGYGLNEDNLYYVYYPHQITLHEINEELK
jgi:tetratricopeptide (TPR) repeat protein